MPSPIDPRRTLLLTFVIFGVQLFLRGAWSVSIPYIKASLRLTKTGQAIT